MNFSFVTDVPGSFWIGMLHVSNASADELQWADGTTLNCPTCWNSLSEREHVIQRNEVCVTMGHPCCPVVSELKWFSVGCDEKFMPSFPSFICQRLKSKSSVIN